MLNVPETPSQVWGEGERPNWLVPDELQPLRVGSRLHIE